MQRISVYLNAHKRALRIVLLAKGCNFRIAVHLLVLRGLHIIRPRAVACIVQREATLFNPVERVIRVVHNGVCVKAAAGDLERVQVVSVVPVVGARIERGGGVLVKDGVGPLAGSFIAEGRFAHRVPIEL